MYRVFIAIITIIYASFYSSGEVVNVWHEPEEITQDDEVVIYVEFSNAENITSVYLFYCSEFFCYIPKEMVYVGSNTYSINIGKFEQGAEIKYNITFYEKNGSKNKTIDYKFKVKENLKKEIKEDNKSTMQVPISVIIILIALVAICIIALVLKRRY